MWPNLEETANFATFTEKLNFLYSDLDQPFSLINKSKTNTKIVITVKPLKTLLVSLYAYWIMIYCSGLIQVLCDSEFIGYILLPIASNFESCRKSSCVLLFGLHILLTCLTH